MFQINNYKEKLVDLCDQNLVVNKLYFFGSVLSSRFDEDTSVMSTMKRRLQFHIPPLKGAGGCKRR